MELFLCFQMAPPTSTVGTGKNNCSSHLIRAGILPSTVLVCYVKSCLLLATTRLGMFCQLHFTGGEPWSRRRKVSVAQAWGAPGLPEWGTHRTLVRDTQPLLTVFSLLWTLFGCGDNICRNTWVHPCWLCSKETLPSGKPFLTQACPITRTQWSTKCRHLFSEFLLCVKHSPKYGFIVLYEVYT